MRRHPYRAQPARFKFFYALSLGIKRGQSKTGAGYYFVTLWHLDRLKLQDVSGGQGVVFQVEHEVGSQG